MHQQKAFTFYRSVSQTGLKNAVFSPHFPRVASCARKTTMWFDFLFLFFGKGVGGAATEVGASEVLAATEEAVSEVELEVVSLTIS